MLIRRQLEHPELLMLDVPMFVATCGSVAAFYVVAHQDLYGGRWEAIKRLPAMMALGIGLSVNNGRAAIEGMFGRDVEFVRTPKRGALDGRPESGAKGYTGRWPWHNTVELGFGLYCSASLIIAVATQSWASVPFLLLFCVGFSWVGLASLHEALLGAQGDSELTEHEPSTHSSPNPQSILS
jgi:hypothetical protein